jgi:hypothetical protein
MQCEIEAFHFLATQEICPTSLLTQAIRLHTSTGAPDQFCPFGPVLARTGFAQRNVVNTFSKFSRGE